MRLVAVSPLDFFRRTTIGVAGTAMPAFETRLSAEDRWAAADYATLLRYPAPAGEVPTGLRAFGTTARMTDTDIAAVLGLPVDQAGPTLAAVRSFHLQESAEEASAVFAQVNRQLDSVLALAAAGQPAAASGEAFEAYLTFEQVESSRPRQGPGAGERARGGVRHAARPCRRRRNRRANCRRCVRSSTPSSTRAERVLGEPMTATDLFIQSFVILLREGLEAILLIGALIAFLMKTGNGQRRRDIHVGVIAAVVVSLLTAVAFETIFRFYPASQEVLEGATMLVATVALFYVSYWLLSKMEVAKWNRFVKGKVQDALTSGSAFALPSVAFLAVYREGVETVLFYKALMVAGPAGGSVLPVVAGIILASVVLGVVYVLINRFGVKLPLKPFFGGHQRLPLLHGVRLRGEGHRGASGRRRHPDHGRQLGAADRTARHLPDGRVAGRAGACSSSCWSAALVWTFYLEPRRLRVTQELVPEPQRPDETPPARRDGGHAARPACRSSRTCSARSSGWTRTWPSFVPRSNG